MTELSPDLDMNRVKASLGDYPRLSHNDDLKIDWDDKVHGRLFIRTIRYRDEYLERRLFRGTKGTTS